MNNARRKIIREAVEYLDGAVEILEVVAQLEEDAYGNMPEGIQMSEQGDKISENIVYLEETISNIRDMIEELEVM